MLVSSRAFPTPRAARLLCLTALASALAACGADSEPTAGFEAKTSATVADTAGRRGPALRGEVRTESRPETRIRTEPPASKPAEQKAKGGPAEPPRTHEQQTTRRPRTRQGPDKPPPTNQRKAPAGTTTQDTPRQAPQTETTTSPSQPLVHDVIEHASLTLVRKEGLTFFQEGAVRGTLNGRMRLRGGFGGEGVVGQFTATLGNGTLVGRGSGRITLDKTVAHFKGTVTINKGTGTYANLVPTQLGFSGTFAADGSWSKIRLAGELRY
jgi:hypothetical protein